MADARKPAFTLIGGGLGGALLATYLGRAGYPVDLYERRSDPAAGNIVGGRSINLAISVRGINALQEVGLADEIMRIAIPMRGRMIHSPSGELHFQPYDRDPSRHINSIGRAGLNAALLDAAEKLPGVRVNFDWKCADVDLDAPAAELVHSVTGEQKRVGGDVLIGIDGAFSAVRRAMQRLDRFDYSQEYLGHGYKELTIPPKSDGGFALDPNALHIWPRKSFMMIALPNPDGSFTCTLFLQYGLPQAGQSTASAASQSNSAAPTDDSFATLHSRETVLSFFERNFRDAIPLMPTLLDDFERNPVGSMVTVRCSPWHYRGKVAIVGDAAHAVVPFYGQGMNAAFEDCTVLNGCISRHAPNWERVFTEYETSRKQNTDTLADLAIGNFIEMRDHTGARWFRMRKKLERTLEAWFPHWYTPLYAMVSFTRTPYAEAVRKARRQDRIVIIATVLASITLLTLLFAWLSPGRLVEKVSAASVVVYLAVQIAMFRLSRVKRESRRSGDRT